LQQKINNLDELNKKMPKISDAYRQYGRIKSDKITIYLSDELIELTEKNNEDNLVVSNIKLRQDITDKYAYVIPNIRYSDDAELEPFQYRIDIREVPAATGLVYPSYRMLCKGQSNLTRKPSNAISGIDPIYFLDVFWLKEEDTKDFWEKGLSASQVISQHLGQLCIKHAQDLLDYKDVNKFMEIVRKENFDLAENVVPEIVAMGDLRYILASLVRERVPIKDITFIFEKIMDLYSFAVDKEILLEKLRIALKRQISYSICDSNSVINSITIEPDLEKYIKDNLIESENSASIINFSDEETELLMTNTAKIIENAKVRIENSAIITTPSIRQSLFSFYEEFIPGLTILAYEEVSNEINLEEIGTLSKKVIYKSKKKK
ncbi:MAG: FHIPEP family type III secretion protein, partial [Cyanobacteriota bacterium]